VVDWKGLLKRAGKGLVIASASVLAGAVLGPVAATAVGGFISKKLGEAGVTVAQDVIDRRMEDMIMGTPGDIVRLYESHQMEKLSKDVAAEAGISEEEAAAAVQYALRDLQTTMGGISGDLQNDPSLLQQALALAQETDLKIDSLTELTQRTQQSVDEIRSMMKEMERHLDMSYRKVVGSFADPSALNYDRLMIMSRLQKQNTTLASRFDVVFNPELYVRRENDEDAFHEFMSNAGMTDRNVFLVLGDVGMGKTWFLARLAWITLQNGFPTFFVPLRHGVRSLTGIFHTQSLTELVTLLDSVLAPQGKHAFIFLDGLDEMPSREVRNILSAVSTSRVGTISFILTCRCTDWTSEPVIVQGSHDLAYYIHENDTAIAKARPRGVSTSLSVLMAEFNDTELAAALERYGLPSEIPHTLEQLLKKPFLLRLIARKYSQTGVLPSPTSHDFLDLFAGEADQVFTVLGRLGIITQRDALYTTVEQFIDSKSNSIALSELKSINPEDATFRILVSSGLLLLNVTRYGTAVSLSPDFQIPLLALTILRHESRPSRKEQLTNSLLEWIPDIAPKVMVLLQPPKEPPIRKVIQAADELQKIETSSAPEVSQRVDTLSGLLTKKATATEIDDGSQAVPEPIVTPTPAAPESFDAYLQALSNPDPSARQDAVDKLGRLKDSRAVNPLIKVLEDRDEKVRAMAVRSLALIGDEKAVEPLRKFAESTSDKSLAIKARWAADRIADKKKGKF
jgi:hypothetical protein